MMTHRTTRGAGSSTAGGVWTRVLRLAGSLRLVGLAAIVMVACYGATEVLAQSAGSGAAPASTPAAPAGGAAGAAGAGGDAALGGPTLRDLFAKSFDLFTILLVIGSIAGWTIIIKCIIEIRQANIAPREPEQIIANLARTQRWGELRQFVNDDGAMVSRVVRAAMDSPGDDMNAVREAAELAASEESARWFRKIEPLNVIGNLGPLLGLAGTVYGMIIAFAELGGSGGQANPATLSTGIAKALFHTLLGLLLAVPCLTVFGLYRSLVDRLCTRAIVSGSNLIELLPADPRLRGVEARPGAARAGTPAGARSAAGPAAAAPNSGPAR